MSVWLFPDVGPLLPLLYLETLLFLSGLSQGRVQEHALPDSFEAKKKPHNLDFSDLTYVHVILT